MIHYTCDRIRSHPTMNLSICVGRWTEAQTEKKSPCKNCPIFYEHLAELVAKVMRRKR